MRIWAGESSGLERRYASLARAHWREVEKKGQLLWSRREKSSIMCTHFGRHVSASDDADSGQCAASLVNVGRHGPDVALRHVDDDDASFRRLSEG